MKPYLVQFVTGRAAYVLAEDEDAAHALAQDTLPATAPGLVTEIDAMPDSQAMYEAMFSRAPHVDTRTPKDVRNGVTP